MGVKTTCKIVRSELDRRQSFVQTYTIDLEEPMTVLMVLQQIYETEDATLAFRNYQCYRGICHACMMMINGRKMRSCSYLIRPGEEVLIAPLEGYRVIRDLVVDFRQ